MTHNILSESAAATTMRDSFKNTKGSILLPLAGGVLGAAGGYALGQNAGMLQAKSTLFGAAGGAYLGHSLSNAINSISNATKKPAKKTTKKIIKESIEHMLHESVVAKSKEKLKNGSTLNSLVKIGAGLAAVGGLAYLAHNREHNMQNHAATDHNPVHNNHSNMEKQIENKISILKHEINDDIKDIDHSQNEINKIQHSDNQLLLKSAVKQYQNQIKLDKHDIEVKRETIERLEKDLKK